MNNQSNIVKPHRIALLVLFIIISLLGMILLITGELAGGLVALIAGYFILISVM